MKKEIFRSDWHQLTENRIKGLFNEIFGDNKLQPNKSIVHKLKELRVATLECVENRENSTIYRIKQIDKEYQVSKETKSIMVSDDIPEYSNKKPPDRVISSFEIKPAVHKYITEGEQIYIERLKYPRFRAVINKISRQKSLYITEWIDPEPVDPVQVSSLLKKAEKFASSYVKFDG